MAEMATKDWTGRLTDLIDRLPEGEEIELDRINVLIGAPDRVAREAELVERVLSGELAVVRGVFWPEPRWPFVDMPLDRALPVEVEDDSTGDTFRLQPERDVELIVSRAVQEAP